MHLVRRLATSGDDAADLRLGAHLDAVPGQCLVHEGAALLVEPAQHAIATDHQVDVAAEPVEDAGELDGDVAAADDGDALGQRIGQVERLVRGDGELVAGDRGHLRPAAGADQNLVGRDRLAADLHGVAIHQPATAHVDLHARPFEQADIDRVQAIDLLLHIVAQGRPGMRGLAVRPTVGQRILELVGEFRAVHQQLLRHAAPDHAGTTDAIVLADADAGAVARGDARGAHAA